MENWNYNINIHEIHLLLYHAMFLRALSNSYYLNPNTSFWMCVPKDDANLFDSHSNTAKSSTTYQLEYRKTIKFKGRERDRENR